MNTETNKGKKKKVLGALFAHATGLPCPFASIYYSNVFLFVPKFTKIYFKKVPKNLKN